MAKKSSGKNQTEGFGWFPFTEEVLESQAFATLSPSAGKALPIFLFMPGHLKRVGYGKPEYYAVVFSVPHSVGAKYGFANRTFARVIDELISVGFIDPVEKGGLKGYGKTSSKFKASRRWKKYGKFDFVAVSWKTFIEDPR